MGTYPKAPLFRHSSVTAFSAFAVTMMIGTLESTCWKCLRTSTPLMPGMAMSRKTTSGRARANCARASAPDAAVLTV